MAGSIFGSLVASAGEGELGIFPFFLVFSVPFTIVGASILSLVGLLIRDRLNRNWISYIPIGLTALVLGPIMPVLVFGPILFNSLIGGLFALLTAAAWACVHRSACEWREPKEIVDA